MARLIRALRTNGGKVAFAALAISFAIAHVAGGFTESVNWDEFALVQRAERAILTDFIDGGGRPGLGVIALVPFARDCTSTMAVMDATRIAWAIVTLALIAGLFSFLRLALRRADDPWLPAALGASLLVLVPNFIRWSLHVRTDQPAVAAALWGGVALLASRKRVAWSIVGGLACGGGYLFSQKALYIVALAGVVAAGDVFIEGKLVWRREALRIAGASLGGVIAIAAYYVLVPLFYTPREVVSLDRAIEIFGWYRQALGYRAYADMLPTLYPHIAGLALLVAATLHAARRDLEHKRSLLVALAVMACGFAVGRFHAAAFPYFWMTLGVFFATAIALGWPGICALLGRAHLPVLCGLIVWMLCHAVPATLATLVDTQAVQDETFAFVDRNFDRDAARPARGLHPDGAFFCRRDPDPIPGWFVQTLKARFSGALGAKRTTEFIHEHYTRPISFIVDTPRTLHYPDAVVKHWLANYVPYFGPLQLAGRRIAGAAGEHQTIEIVVPARYRWFTVGGGTITVDDKPLDDDGTIELAAGAHEVTIGTAVAAGMLVLAVHDPPQLSNVPFYALPGDLEFWRARAERQPPPRWTAGTR